MSEESEKIKKCFIEALIDARGNNGIIGYSSHWRLYEIGINSAAAQHEILNYFKLEAEKFEKTGMLPSYFDIQMFLDRMGFQFSGCTLLVAKKDEIIKSAREGEKNHEKNTDEVSQITKTIPKSKRHEGHGNAASKNSTRNKNHKNSSRGTLRPRRWKTEASVDRRRLTKTDLPSSLVSDSAKSANPFF